MSLVPVGPGTRITLKFSLALADGGAVIDATGDRPATCDIGDGSLLPGFEQAMFGLRAGESAELVIPAARGFGLPNDDNVHRLRRQIFSPDIDLIEGLVVSFADGEGGERPGVISRIFDEVVEVDFNHPLAGKDLRFHVDIIEVVQVSDEIIRV